MIVVEKMIEHKGWTIEQSVWVRSGIEPASHRRHYIAYKGEQYIEGYTSLSAIQKRIEREERQAQFDREEDMREIHESRYCEDYPACGHTPDDPCARQEYDEPGYYDTSVPGQEHRLCDHENGECYVE